MEDVSIAEEAVRCFVDIASLCSINHTAYLKRHTAGLWAVEITQQRCSSPGVRALGILASHLVQDHDDIKAWRADLPWDLDSTLQPTERFLMLLRADYSRSGTYAHVPYITTTFPPTKKPIL